MSTQVQVVAKFKLKDLPEDGVELRDLRDGNFRILLDTGGDYQAAVKVITRGELSSYAGKCLDLEAKVLVQDSSYSVSMFQRVIAWLTANKIPFTLEVGTL